MKTDNQRFVALKKFICLLNEREAAEKSSRLVYGNGLIVGAGLTLKGNHGIKGKKVLAVAAQDIIKGNIIP